LQRTCCGLAVFTVVFATAMTRDPLFYGLVVVFAAGGIWWLMGTHWESLGPSLAAESRTQRPLRWMLALPVSVAAALLLLPIAGRDAVRGAFGFVPSSGGTDTDDPYSRDGVGSGERLVAGSQDIQTFAPLDDAPFLSSHEPSLYDVFDESYDEPVKPREKNDRAMSLPPSVLADLRERHLSDTQKANREFSTLRKDPGTKRGRGVESIRDDALLFVTGRMPVHLRLAVHDVFDGTAWHEEPPPSHPRPMRIATVRGKPWLVAADLFDQTLFPAEETHAVKFVNLRTDRLPAPPGTLGLHVADVDRPDLFRWAQPSIAALAVESVPELLVVHAHAALVDEAVLPERTLPAPAADSHHGLVPDVAERNRIAELAREWTAEAAPGWDQVRRIVERLRTGYVHDPQARPADDGTPPVVDFLFRSRRGPDYQFATAAVLLLRSLGYSARFVTGFHARESDYDARTRHAAIRAEHAHAWAEVEIGHQTWAAVEPTPGFELAGPPVPWSTRIAAALATGGRFAARHRVPMSVLAFLGIGLFANRRILSDTARVLHFRLREPRDPRQAVLLAFRLIERRAVALKVARPSGVPAAEWYGQVVPLPAPADAEDLSTLARLADWAAFAGPTDPPPASVDPLPVARRLVRGLTWARWRTALRAGRDSRGSTASGGRGASTSVRSEPSEPRRASPGSRCPVHAAAACDVPRPTSP
jgi:transglutaminase-like putative cysteine protease